MRRYEHYTPQKVALAPRTYNPSLYMPLQVWKVIEQVSMISVKSLILLGWRVRKYRELKLLNVILAGGLNSDRLVDVNSMIKCTQIKRVHVKFFSSETDIASEIYTEHIRRNTTVSNLLLTALIAGMYATYIVLRYRQQGDYVPIVQAYEQTLADLLKNLVHNMVKSGLCSKTTLFRTLLDTLRDLSTRLYRKYVRLINEIEKIDDEAFAELVVDMLFKVRPSKRMQRQVRVVLGL